MEWQTVGGSVWGGRVCMRDTHTHILHRTHTQPRRGHRGQREEAHRLSPPQAPLSLPGVGGWGPRSGGSPALARLCPGGRQAPGDFPWLEKGFLFELSSRLRLAGGQGEGKRRTSPHQRQEIRHPNTRRKNANPQPTHPHTHPHTHTQFYLPLLAKMKLPSDTRSALRVSVHFNDD